MKKQDANTLDAEFSFLRIVGLAILATIGIIAIVWVSIITTSAVIILCAIGFALFLIFLAYELIDSNFGKVVVIALIVIVAYYLFR